MYTFDDEGVFTVMSQGAPSCSCQIHVLQSGVRVARAHIVSDGVGGIVAKKHVVQLKCDTPNAKMFYTTDGSTPELHKLSGKEKSYYDMKYVNTHSRGLPRVCSCWQTTRKHFICITYVHVYCDSMKY